MRLIEEREPLAGFGRERQAIIADDVACEARGAAEADLFTLFQLAEHRRAVGRFDYIGHVAGGGDVGDRQRHPVPMAIEDRADQDPGIERHRLARFEIQLAPGLDFNRLEEIDQLVALVIGAGDVVAAAEIEPLELGQPLGDLRFRRLPSALERGEILLAQGVEVEAVDAFHMLVGELIDREA